MSQDNVPTTKKQLLEMLEGKEIEHEGCWYRIHDGKFVVGGETFDLSECYERQLRYLLIWIARDSR